MLSEDLHNLSTTTIHKTLQKGIQSLALRQSAHRHHTQKRTTNLVPVLLHFLGVCFDVRPRDERFSNALLLSKYF
jgi:hypothetical protein